jgi:hypothetical protein
VIVVRGNLWVRTSREGAFSALGHDLLFELKGFEVEVHESHVSARIDLRRLEPRGALHAGKLAHHALSAAELAQIRQSAHEVVLGTTRYPEARVQGTYEAQPGGASVSVSVELELNGQRASLTFDAQREGEFYRARFALVPSRWGIRPYRAFLGALRLRDSVEVEVEVPDAGLTRPPHETE